MSKESRCEVQKGPIEPHDINSENYKNMSRSQCDQKDYSERMKRRGYQEMEYSPIKHK
jgi:hypothetical protein